MLFLFLATTVLVLPAGAKRKDDVIVFKNGDRLTGEIKRLERGQLYFKNSSMFESVQLDWAAIDQIISKDIYIVELTTGERMEGLIRKTEGTTQEAGKLVINTPRGEMAVNKDDVVLVRPEEDSFWRQLTGSVDLGYSYAQGNGQSTLNFSASAKYLRPAYSVQVGATTNFSQQTGGTRTDRREAYINFEKYITRHKKWLLASYGDVLSSEEQSLQLRTTLGGALGYRPKVTNRTLWTVFGGTVLNREKFDLAASTNSVRDEVEGMIGTDFSSFQFTRSELNTKFRVYPSYTTPGRVRMDFRSDYRIEIVNNWNWKITFFETYDSQPPTTAKKNDLGITFSISWTF